MVPDPTDTTLSTTAAPPAAATMTSRPPAETYADSAHPPATATTFSTNTFTTSRLPPTASMAPTTMRPPTSTASSLPAYLTPAPSRDTGRTFTHHSWKIETHKLPILTSSEIDRLADTLTFPPPEMIFGNNEISLTHIPSGWGIRFTAEEALKTVDASGDEVPKVAYADKWKDGREELMASEVKGAVKAYDWTFTPRGYRGCETAGNRAERLRTDGAAEIPVEKLKRRETILMFDETVLYEDELADNGIALLSGKVRVMGERMLLLVRFYLRLDGVVVRIRDTRVFVEFGTGEVVREWIEREGAYDEVRRGLAMYPADEIPAILRDANQVVDLLKVVAEGKERVVLGP